MCNSQLSERTQKFPLYARIRKVQYDKYNDEKDERSIGYSWVKKSK